MTFQFDLNKKESIMSEGQDFFKCRHLYAGIVARHPVAVFIALKLSKRRIVDRQIMTGGAGNIGVVIDDDDSVLGLMDIKLDPQQIFHVRKFKGRHRIFRRVVVVATVGTYKWSGHRLSQEAEILVQFEGSKSGDKKPDNTNDDQELFIGINFLEDISGDGSEKTLLFHVLII